MRIAILQFAPELGKVQENIERANKIVEATPGIRQAPDGTPLWLVLPEMAFSGYNFSSLEHITPYLEPTCAGPSAQWAMSIAQKYSCYVTLGYPEKAKEPEPNENPLSHNFNSMMTVSPSGEVLVNYRKRFLYYTDETWASEGDDKSTPAGFYSGDLDGVSVAMGICMDINPYKFTEAPWNKYEFANHVLDSGAQLVILSMAWLSLLTPLELAELPLRPDQDTFSYWIERFFPLQVAKGGPTFLVLANRCGVERQACYAGTSSVISFRDGKGYIYDMLGKYDEQCMVVDLKQAPKYEIQTNSGTMSTAI